MTTENAKTTDKLSLKRSLLAAGFPAVVGAQLCTDLYFENAKFLTVGPELLLTVAAVAAVAWLVLFLLLHFTGRLGRVIWSGAVCYTAFYLVRDIAFPPPLGTFDGTNPLESLSIGYAILECAVFAAIVAIWTKLPRQFGTQAAALCTVVFSVFLVVSFATQIDEVVELRASASEESGSKLLSIRPSASSQASKVAESNDTSSPKPNVYHILFDQYQTLLFDAIHSKRGPGPFEDFVWYRENVADYNRTFLCLPAIFASTVYEPELDWNEWRQLHSSGGILKELHDNGYHVQVCGHTEGDWRSKYIDRRSLSHEIAQGQLKGMNSAADYLLALQLRALPSPLAKYAQSRAAKKSQDSPPPPNHYAYWSTIMFRDMVSSLEELPSSGSYTFVHMALPHGPYVLDENGEYVGPDGGADELTHCKFVDVLMAEFIAELKRLGRYDNSLIIVHADTGDYFHTSPSAEQIETEEFPSATNGMEMADWQDGRRWHLPVVEARSQAFLLIKPPGHRGFEIDDSPTSLLDLAPTILNAAGVVDTDCQGIDLLNHPVPSDRVRRTYVLGKRIGGVRVKKLQEYIIENGEYRVGTSIPSGE